MQQTTDSDCFDFIVIGGGAAGFFAAIRFSELCRERGEQPRVLILEQSSQVLSKVLVSGGGRCNVTHACFDSSELVQYYPRGREELRSAFARFQPADTIEWYEKRGVALKTEADGRIFPISDSSKQVIGCLQEAALQADVEVRLRSGVASIHRDPSGRFPFDIRLRPSRDDPGGSPYVQARQLLLASGGSTGGMNLAAALGHDIQPPVPSLFTFKIRDPRLDGLAGVSVPSAGLQLLDGAKPPHGQAGQPQVGPMLITHWGLSGPVVLRLSAWAARWLHAQDYRATLQVNWLHPMRQDQVSAALQESRSNQQRARHAAAKEDPFERLPQRLWRRLVAASGIQGPQRWADLSKAQLHALAQELSAGRFTLQGKATYKEEFVTCGGVALRQVDFQTMQSRLVPGLYFAGEVLDIDGLTGGFNFQNAWTTAWIAATAAAEIQTSRG